MNNEGTSRMPAKKNRQRRAAGKKIDCGADKKQAWPLHTTDKNLQLRRCGANKKTRTHTPLRERNQSPNRVANRRVCKIPASAEHLLQRIKPGNIV
ncbi:hypothetical protein PPMP20_04960 [Paraburkholderia phymatum]|uniref:Uncharacterized protein n=1 Tax=Paraburkholderia phymatum (strain DSM 17167 / CIP 108236 / LMG 21445 / STM815) TaxID=391038 RepID=B2JCG2_PARP8|nr:hypothetical protein [Paraburkholderia phymatum]ACC70963.1 hypothetical protein Bphy_1781 [Paraburkholderia phymatum STM815]